MASLSGETFQGDPADGIYIQHPPAASTYWGNGDSLDAGLAMILRQNLSVLVEQSCRQLTIDVGPGTITQYTSRLDTYTGFVDARPYAVGDTPDEAHEISWQAQCARRYGPFAFVADEVLEDQAGVTLRKVEVVLDHYLDSTAALYLYAAISPSSSPPNIVPPWAITTDLVTGPGGGGQAQTTMLITPTVSVNPVTDASEIMGRAPSTDARGQARAMFGYLWVGYCLVDGVNPGHLFSISAYEKR